MIIEIAVTGIVVVFAILCLLIVVRTIATCYRVVPTSEAHLVTTHKGMEVYTSDKDGIKNASAKNAYYAIPQHVPFFGCQVRSIDLTIKEVVGEQIAYEKNQARFRIDWSLKYKVVDVMRAAETFKHEMELNHMLKAPVESAVNVITTGYEVTVLRSSKIEIQDKVKHLLEQDLASWGLELVTFQLGDFNDTKDSTIISDISKRTEAQINAETRVKVAEQLKTARIAEANADEQASKREIEKDTNISMEKELMSQRVAEQSKTTKMKEAEVKMIETSKEAEIKREKANIEAIMQNEVAEKAKIAIGHKAEADKIKYIKNVEAEAEEVVLNAQADAQLVKLKTEAETNQIKQMAEAESNRIKLKGEAEAEAKTKLADAMKQFTPEAIMAMTAELQIEASKEVGIATAKALENADVKALIGGDGNFSFDIAKIMESFATASPDGYKALLNRIAKPNDLGVNSVINVSETA